MESKHVNNKLQVFKAIRSFNRTSMESKHPCAVETSHARSAFNRTSMESKLVLVCIDFLLVEPFNRTSMESKRGCTAHLWIPCSALLIEPVWNRNVELEFVGRASAEALLIEPVWNRNPCPHENSKPVASAFNRTSMESKPDSA